MKRVITALLLATSLHLPLPAYAEIKTVTHTIKQPFGGSQSPDDARIGGIHKAKREALELFGTYIESTTVVKNAQVDSDEILALTAGVTKAEVIKQKNYTDGDAFGIEITVKVELDTTVLENSLNRLLEDRNHLKDLKDVREREKKLLARIAELEKENQQKGKTRQQAKELEGKFQSASQGLTALEWLYKASILWDGKKFTDPEKVIDYLTQAISLDPNNAAAYALRGFAFKDLKQFNLAIADFGQAIRINPTLEWIYQLRGTSYYKLKQFDRSISDFDQIIRRKPPNLAELYHLRGGVYFELKRFDRALEDYAQSILLDPSDAICFYNRGITYYKLDQFEHAIVDYTRAIHLDPKFAAAYNERGTAYVLLKKTQKGCDDLEKACKLGVCTGYEWAAEGKLCK